MTVSRGTGVVTYAFCPGLGFFRRAVALDFGSLTVFGVVWGGGGSMVSKISSLTDLAAVGVGGSGSSCLRLVPSMSLPPRSPGVPGVRDISGTKLVQDEVVCTFPWPKNASEIFFAAAPCAPKRK